jgi:hypothetical protein
VQSVETPSTWRGTPDCAFAQNRLGDRIVIFQVEAPQNPSPLASLGPPPSTISANHNWVVLWMVPASVPGRLFVYGALLALP